MYIVAHSLRLFPLRTICNSRYTNITTIGTCSRTGSVFAWNFFYIIFTSLIRRAKRSPNRYYNNIPNTHTHTHTKMPKFPATNPVTTFRSFSQQHCVKIEDTKIRAIRVVSELRERYQLFDYSIVRPFLLDGFWLFHTISHESIRTIYFTCLRIDEILRIYSTCCTKFLETSAL